MKQEVELITRITKRCEQAGTLVAAFLEQTQMEPLTRRSREPTGTALDQWSSDRLPITELMDAVDQLHCARPESWHPSSAGIATTMPIL